MDRENILQKNEREMYQAVFYFNRSAVIHEEYLSTTCFCLLILSGFFISGWITELTGIEEWIYINYFLTGFLLCIPVMIISVSWHHRHCLDKVVFEKEGVAVNQRFFLVTDIRSHTGKSPAVVRMHHDQVCLYSQFSKSFYTFLNVSEMCCVEPGKIPVIPHTSACIFLEVLLCEHTGIHRGSLIRIGARLTQVIVIMFRENTKPRGQPADGRRTGNRRRRQRRPGQ